MKPVKKINLALQGGGSHGAYTWGVLDRLLEDDRVEIEGISGTSAGAMNAAILTAGYAAGGRAGARENLDKFWLRVSEIGAFGPYNKSYVEQLFTGWNMDYSPAYNFLDMISRIFSPYVLNPFNINPLRYVMEGLIDFPNLCARSTIKLFITATHVASGQARVFHRDEINADVLMASACIPFMFQAVEIDGEAYWDGGYMGNPTIWPLIYHCESEDVLLVQINPIHRDGVPKRSYDIINRLNEISFNSSLIAEMRAIQFVSNLIHEGKLSREEYKDMRMHLVYSAAQMQDLDASSKLNASWDFFMHMKAMGRQAAEEWLNSQWDEVGVRSSVNIEEKFLTGAPNARHHARRKPMDELLKKSLQQSEQTEQHQEPRTRKNKP